MESRDKSAIGDEFAIGGSEAGTDTADRSSEAAEDHG